MTEHDHVIIAGGQRCGSTFLYDLLGQHPSVTKARQSRPEPKYFLTGDDHAEYDRSFFPEPGAANLEKSTTYLEAPSVPGRIARAIPSAKVVIVLRDPVERAVSNWRFSSENGLESLPLEAALTTGAERRQPPPGLSTSPFHYLRRGHYELLLPPWVDALGDRLHLMLFEQLRTSPHSVLHSLQSALGLAREPVVVDAARRNDSHYARTMPGGLRERLAEEFAPTLDFVMGRFPTASELWPTFSTD